MAVTKMISRLHIEIKRSLYPDVCNIKSYAEAVSTQAANPAFQAAKLKFFSEDLVKCVIEKIIKTFRTERQITLPIEDVQKLIDSGKIVIKLKIGDSFVSLKDEDICPKCRTIAELSAYSQEKNPGKSEMVLDISFVGEL